MELFVHCKRPLFLATAWELRPHKIVGDWRLFEDRVGKPGFIIDDRLERNDVSPPMVNHTQFDGPHPELTFKVPLTIRGEISISYLKSYENMGRMVMWLDTKEPTEAFSTAMLNGMWQLNYSMTSTHHWIPNKLHVKQKTLGKPYIW